MFGLNIRVVCVVSVRKIGFWGQLTQVPKNDTQQQQRLIFLFLFLFSASCVCVCVWGGGEGGQKHLYPPCPPSRGNAVPYLSKIYGKPSTGGRNSFLKLNHLFKFFEVLSLVFVCICNEND